MYVTATEFKANLGKYMALAEEQEIIVTRRGKPDLAMGQPKKKSRAELVEALCGVLPLNEETRNITVQDIRAERRKRYEYPD
jgi:hypothetical protein